MVLVAFSDRVKLLAPAAIRVHPNAPKQFGICLSWYTMKQVSAIQKTRQCSNQPIKLDVFMEDDIQFDSN